MHKPDVRFFVAHLNVHHQYINAGDMHTTRAPFGREPARVTSLTLMKVGPSFSMTMRRSLARLASFFMMLPEV